MGKDIGRYEKVEINKLIPYKKNARTHSVAQIKKIQASIKEFGFINPVLIDGEYNIIAGHGRIEAAKLENMKDVPCLFIEGLTKEQKQAYIIADNRLALDAEWDMGILKFEMKELKDFDFNIELTGFDFAEINEILLDDTKEVVENDFEVELPENPISKLGDIYQLGRHRLMCGDSTSVSDTDMLMDGKKAGMTFTDPPYNVSIGTIKHEKFKQREIMNDQMTTEDYKRFCKGFIENIARLTDGCIYMCSGQGPDGRIMFTIADELMHCSTTIIWNKDQFTLGRGKYHNRYEPIWFGWANDGSSFTDDRTLENVWDIPRPQKSELHPTMKPLKIMETAMKHNPNAESVLDLFGGSGSTLISAEQLGRVCYMMELDPKYIDVIIKRYEDFTGNKAVLLNP